MKNMWKRQFSIKYLAEGSAIIFPQVQVQTCSDIQFKEMTDGAGEDIEWNKGEPSCPLPGCADDFAWIKYVFAKKAYFFLIL